MYDLNLTVPNLTSPKYSSDNRFLLLKNYLYQLNETLSFALSDKTDTVIEEVRETVKDNKNEELQNVLRLKQQSLKRFEELKEKILLTAEEITLDYTTAISQSETEILQTARGEFATKTEVGEYKNEVGTQFAQTAGKISVLAETSEELATDLENYKKSTNAEFSVQAEAIISQVENGFLSKTDGEEIEERIGSQITQTAENVTENFYQGLSSVEEDISTVGGELTELVSSLDVYIRRGELEEGIYGIEIGRSDSNVKARFTNDRLSFFQGLTEVAYISGSNLYITRAEILDYLKIGNETDGYFTFDITENGLEVRWSDGG